MKGRTDVRTYVVRTDVDDVMAIKPNFLTSMGYHILLTITNCRQYCFGFLGIISAVLMSRMEVKL